MARALTWRDLAIGSRLGEGNSGTVYVATLRPAFASLPAGARVAVKTFKSWVLEQPGQIERIFREVDVGRKVTHPNLMSVLGAVLDDAGRPAIVMKYYTGETLDTILRRRTEAHDQVDAAAAFGLLRDISAGIAALHEQGVIHRDLKPANIIVTDAGPIVADFGVVQSERFPEQTTTGTFLGTIRYAEPEYLFGAEPDRTVDVYALGAIAYELFTSEQFLGDSHHWAAVVAAKLRKVELSVEQLDRISLHHGYNTAEFLHYVLSHSLCERPKRDLDLNALFIALERELWKNSFIAEDGRLVAGTKTFAGRYHDAHEAAATLRAQMTGDELAKLQDFLRVAYWWDIVDGSVLTYEDATRFRALGIVQRAKYIDMSIYPIQPVIKEAFALGLLNP